MFLDKLDNFLTYNHMVPVETPRPTNDTYLVEKQMDISACILELMFITEKDNDDSIEDVVTVISENIVKLDEIFANTEYSTIKAYIKNLLEWINIETFEIEEFRNKLLELRG